MRDYYIIGVPPTWTFYAVKLYLFSDTCIYMAKMISPNLGLLYRESISIIIKCFDKIWAKLCWETVWLIEKVGQVVRNLYIKRVF